jgi:hypothetical protein
MDIKDFFDLPEAQRDLLVELHRTQKMVRHTKEGIFEERRRLETRELNNQNECQHPFADSKYTAHENEFGNLTGGGTYYYHCEDCGKRWTTDK